MEIDPPSASRPTLKRRLDAKGGDSPAHKKVLRDTRTSPEPSSDAEEPTSPSPLTTTKRKKKAQAPGTKSKRNSAGNPAPSPPRFNPKGTSDPPAEERESQFTINPSDEPFSFETPRRPLPPIDEDEASGEPEMATEGNDPSDTFLGLDEDWELDHETSVTDMLSHIREGKGTHIVAAEPATKGGEWHVFRSGGDRPELDHRSDNPYDFIPAKKFEALIEFWRNPQNPSTLTSDEKRFLAEPKIKKMLIKVVCKAPLPEDKRTAWFRAAILSVLSQNKADVRKFGCSRLAFDMKKPGYSWIVVPVTLPIFKALTNVRGALDPRSGTLVLFRQWKEASPPTQHLYAFGIHRAVDSVSPELATADYLEQMAESLAGHQIQIKEMTPGRWGDKADFGTRIRFEFNPGTIPSIIAPENLAAHFWTGPGNTKKSRNVNYRWPPKCYTCESESHLVAACPWDSIEVGGRKPNFFNCKDHGPGWEEPQAKMRRPRVAASTGLVDIRPRHKKKRDRKEGSLKGKERALDNEVLMD